MDAATLWQDLLTSRCRFALAPDIAEAGLYAIFLSSGTLGRIAPSESGLLYIGMTDASLEARNHLTQKSSGFSTLRRSIGALLRDDLGLTAIPRSPGSVRSVYKFTLEGEERLTRWMVDHLDYGFAIVPLDRVAKERRLILEREPPLNLTGWRNPQGSVVREMRRLCADQAQRQ